MLMNLSENFTLKELTDSNTAVKLGIDNTPPGDVVPKLQALAVNVLQPLRNWYGKPICISSGYRCPRLNIAVGGSKTSQHLRGEAADIDIKGDLTAGRKMFEYIKNNLVFDQLIWEHDKSGCYWVHVSYKSTGRNRHDVIGNLLKKG